MKQINVLLLTSVFFLAFMACKRTIVNPIANHYGETITADNVMSYAELMSRMEKEGGLENVKFKGKVESVCKVKGCWMNIVPADGSSDDEGVFVKFKDYGFFMPLDCDGREVIMEGNAYTEVTSVDELRHYAEDEGLPQEEIDKITEPKEELKFEAIGVIMLDEK